MKLNLLALASYLVLKLQWPSETKGLWKMDPLFKPFMMCI